MKHTFKFNNLKIHIPEIFLNPQSLKPENNKNEKLI